MEKLIWIEPHVSVLLGCCIVMDDCSAGRHALIW